MKRFILIILSLVSLQGALAQDNNQDFAQKLFEAKAKEIKNSLELTDQKFQRFKPVYRQYEQEINQVISSNRHPGANKHAEKRTARETMTTQFDNGAKILEIKRRYLEQFAAIFSDAELIRFYQTETSIRNKIKKEFNSRKSN